MAEVSCEREGENRGVGRGGKFRDATEGRGKSE